MQIRLIHPSQLDDSGKPTHYKELCFPSLTLPTVAALTPNHHDVRTTFDAVETIDFDEDVDLVGITALTNNAPRAYQIAKQFRERGKTVVMGGMHATALPDEALQHVNSVVIGEAENNWPRLLKDFEERRELQPIYSSAQLPDLQELSIPRFDLMGLEHCMRIPFKKDEIPVIPIATTRGCPYRCSFCSVTKFFGGTFRTKPISNVLREIEAAKAAGAQTIFFVDDNVMGNADYAEELFTALIPLHLTWSSHCSTTVLRTPRLVELAGKSGCNEVLLGLESIDPQNLRSVKKGFNRHEDYRELFRLLIDNGISPQASIMIGLDHDTPELLARTTDFLIESEVVFCRIPIATPYPGTEFYRDLEQQGRLFERDWSKYDNTHALYHPKQMAAAELEQTLWKMYEQTYSASSIMKRLWRVRRLYTEHHRSKHSLIFDLTSQLYSRMCARKRIDPLSNVPAS